MVILNYIIQKYQTGDAENIVLFLCRKWQEYFEAGKSRFAVCKKSIIYKDQGDTVKMYYTGDDFSQAVPLLADWVWITGFGIEIAVMGAGLIGVIRQGKRIHRNNLRKQSNRVKSESAF